ncbi:hypothetical protein [Salinibacillus xinjiangensis]|uniref:Uncharacterized protein n=1 Tax=Salinibacillus xinjiangensis TaxID=1229268 RepID=A0A6G1X7Z1_9BACI|nr:hypothetical protein [Salinibacillus xinjiangensis]MRG87049.1 hypothetical protein [Salinibacillus xinjiangensis]
MEKLRKKLFWLIPLAIVLVGLAILYIINLQRFTAPPTEDWSRDLPIATIDGYHDPQVEVNEGQVDIIYSQNKELVKKSFDSDLREIKEEPIPTKVDSWDDFYVYKDKVFYFDEEKIMNGATTEVIAEAELFHPANDQIYYAKGQDIFALNLNTNDTQKVVGVSHPVQEIQSSDNYLLVYTNNLNRGQLTFFEKQENDQYKEVISKEVNVGASNKINQMVFTSDQNKIYLGVSAESQSSQNKQFFFLYSEFSIQNPEIELVDLKPYDPVTKGPLENISQFELRPVDGGLEVLFRSVGFTYTDTNDNQAMNIYSMLIGDNSEITVERRSNNYALASAPFFFGDEAVGWKEIADQNQYQLKLASSNPNVVEQAEKTSVEEYLVGFGMSIGSLSTSVFLLYFMIVWTIIPIVYLGVVSLFYRYKDRNRDMNNNPWILYLGVLIYVAGALVMRDHLFPANAYLHAPDYIKFAGNDFFFILLFALFSLISVKLIKRDWGVIGKYSYFLGIQYLLYIVVLGPFYF